MTLERQLAIFTAHFPALALTLSERASSYYNALDNARFITPHKSALALMRSENVIPYASSISAYSQGAREGWTT